MSAFNIQKAKEASSLIINHCPKKGEFLSQSDGVSDFLLQLSKDINKFCFNDDLFGPRHREHVSCAISLIQKNTFLNPLSAIASVFLVTRLEMYFRVLSKRLKNNGEWISKEIKDETIAVLPEIKINYNKIFDINLSYKIFLLNENELTSIFESLENSLTFFSGISDKVIGKRLKDMRDPATHGFYSDLSSEAYFYALLIGIIFYGQEI